MPLCKIADRLVQLNCRYGYTPRLCEEYTVDGGEADFTVSADESEIEELRASSDSKFSSGYLESLIIYRKLCLDMIRHDGFLLHGSAVEYNGGAYLFCAKSGVGKTTHTLLWRSEFGDAVGVINGDKPIIRRMENGTFNVYGTPWSGKENMNTNTSAPLKAICFIERGDHNECVEIDKKEAVKRLMTQVMMLGDRALMMTQIKLIDQMLKSVPTYRLVCLPDSEAAHVSFDAMVKK